MRYIFIASLTLIACASEPRQEPKASVEATRESAPKIPPNVKSVAVMPMRAKGQADKQVLDVLDDLLLSTLQEMAGREMRIVGKSDIDAMLGFEATRDAAGCNDVSCTAEIAGSLGVDSILSPVVGTLGQKHLLTLVWLDQRKAEPLQRLSESLGVSEVTFDTGVRNAVALLLGMNDRVVAIPNDPPPAVKARDPFALANGSTPNFHPCGSHQQCRIGSVCVDNGGDGIFYCKPVCSDDSQCNGFGYASIGCRKHLYADGKVYERRVCNDKESHLLQVQ